MKRVLRLQAETGMPALQRRQCRCRRSGRVWFRMSHPPSRGQEEHRYQRDFLLLSVFDIGEETEMRMVDWMGLDPLVLLVEHF